MIILKKGQENEIVMNINNNSRTSFSAYTLTFVHSMSQEEKTYSISTSNPTQYGSNERYCEIILPLDTDDLNYQGQYSLKIFGNGTNLVYTGMARLDGPAEENPFTSYVSNNEDNDNNIYISD